MSHTIVFTGGGTAGHVTPNIELIRIFQQDGWSIHYIGSEQGVEKDMMTRLSIPYHAVSTGKLRRYFSLQNCFDPFKIVYGFWQAYHLLRQLKPEVVFSKGGFVAFPVVVGAWLHGIPVVAHESDMTPGLANRLSFPFLNKICVTFAVAKQAFKRQDKVVVTGTPIRQALFHGQKQSGLALCGFTEDIPCILVVGGSQGAQALNACVRSSLEHLCASFQIIHLCGKGKVEPLLLGKPRYYQFEYVDQELPDLFAAAEMVISRAGANSLYEILALKKPHVLVPLSAQVSRGDQVHNARYFQKQGISTVIDESELTSDTLCAAVNQVMSDRDAIIKKISILSIQSATEAIVAVIKEQVHEKS